MPEIAPAVFVAANLLRDYMQVFGTVPPNARRYSDPEPKSYRIVGVDLDGWPLVVTIEDQLCVKLTN